MRIQNQSRRIGLTSIIVAVAVIALVALAIACGGDGDGSSTDGSPPAGTGTATPTQPPGTALDSCDPGDGPPSAGAGAELEGTISYVRLVFGCNPDVYIMDANGDNARPLVENVALDDESDLSPDGTKVVFFSTREGNAFLYTVNVDGTDLEQITEGGGGDVSPRWSPDGTKISFSRSGTLYVIDAEGGNETLVMQSESAADAAPCRAGAFVGGWSPTGESLVYYSAILAPEGNRFWVCSVGIDGSEPEVLVSEPETALHAEPHWSPDGTKIAFRDDRDSPPSCGTSSVGCDYDIFVLDLETGEETNVTDFPGLDIEPVWSPDGEWILFASNRDDPNFDLYVIRPDGSDLQLVLSDPQSKDSYPSWR